jgi:hypothetical protein
MKYKEIQLKMAEDDQSNRNNYTSPIINNIEEKSTRNHESFGIEKSPVLVERRIAILDDGESIFVYIRSRNGRCHRREYFEPGR